MNTLNKSKPLLIYGKPGIGKSHLADNLSDGMVVTKIDSSMLKTIKKKYKQGIPANITTIKHFQGTEENANDFLTYGSSTKHLYLLLMEDL